MAEHVVIKKNDSGGAIIYFALVDASDGKSFKASPTIASGDFKVSRDGDALANPGTIPVVDPAASIWVKMVLTQAEINGDNLLVQGIDQTGSKEWADIALNIPTGTRKLEDLAHPTTSGRSTDVTAGGTVGIDWGNVENPTTAVDLSATDIQLADTTTTNTDMVGTDSALLASTFTTMFSGITALAEWLGIIAGKQAGDATALTEMKATGAGSGTLDPTTDSNEALRDTAPMGSTMVGTDGANTTTPPTAAANATELLDQAAGVETSWTVRQAFRIMLAAVAGKLSGAATTTNTIRNPEDDTNRIVATVDSSGNRSAVTYDKT